jgi:hypothetical protein
MLWLIRGNKSIIIHIRNSGRLDTEQRLIKSTAELWKTVGCAYMQRQMLETHKLSRRQLRRRFRSLEGSRFVVGMMAAFYLFLYVASHLRFKVLLRTSLDHLPAFVKLSLRL